MIDAQGGVVLPGFVDPHTHLVFAGDRAEEWEQRLAGKPYLEILREGGGILSTVRKTRAASFEELSSTARRWALRCLSLGTTTIEAKSGYCLEREGELKLLEVAAALGRELPLESCPRSSAPTWCRRSTASGAAPTSSCSKSCTWRSTAAKLAEFVDVFCETEAFTLDEAERLLTHARGLGFGLKLHAEQFTASGAAALGARLGAVSVDHLEHLSESDLKRVGVERNAADRGPASRSHVSPRPRAERTRAPAGGQRCSDRPGHRSQSRVVVHPLDADDDRARLPDPRFERRRGDRSLVPSTLLTRSAAARKPEASNPENAPT